ncbi:hypothetical protein [Kribbella sp. DT2]|uniref:hypothetical protein n=1 Tax=Kribbella sp. DT2 TaxID=3393427 RepID=UPI003CED0E03
MINEYDAPADPSPQMPSNGVTSDPEQLATALTAAGFGEVEVTVERFRHQATAERALGELGPDDFVQSGTLLYSTARAG